MIPARNVEYANNAGTPFPPQVLAGVTADMKIAEEEVFGPVMTIIKVPDNSDETCVKMINSSK